MASCKIFPILETNSVFYRNNLSFLILAVPCNLDFRTIICSYFVGQFLIVWKPLLELFQFFHGLLKK